MKYTDKQIRDIKLDMLCEALALEHYERTGHTSILDFGQNGYNVPEGCSVCINLQTSHDAIEQVEVRQDEPPFTCAKCGCAGEFYQPWHICESCFKEVYPQEAQAINRLAMVRETLDELPPDPGRHNYRPLPVLHGWEYPVSRLTKIIREARAQCDGLKK